MTNLIYFSWYHRLLFLKIKLHFKENYTYDNLVDTLFYEIIVMPFVNNSQTVSLQ